MMEKGFFHFRGFPGLQTETPPPVYRWGWRRAEDPLSGGVKEKRPREGGVGPTMLSPAGLTPHSIGIIGLSVKIMRAKTCAPGRPA